VLDPWLGVPRRILKEGRGNLVYRFDSEDVSALKLRLKVEINTREHFTELGVVRVPFRVDNPWFTGAADASTYAYLRYVEHAGRRLTQPVPSEVEGSRRMIDGQGEHV